MTVNVENWRETAYQFESWRAFTALEYIPDSDDPHFQVVVISDEAKEKFCKSFTELGEACHFLNRYYGHWSLSSKKEQKKEGSCGSCVAH